MVISAYCVFQVANQHTFGYLFERDLGSPERRDHLRSMIGDWWSGWLTPPAEWRRERHALTLRTYQLVH